jgi:hypothetical protein
MNTELTQEQKDAASQAARERQAQVTAQARMILWDKKMSRAFKGIVAAPKRRANLIKFLGNEDHA